MDAQDSRDLEIFIERAAHGTTMPHCRKCDFLMTDAVKPLAAVSAIIDAGNFVVSDECCIEDWWAKVTCYTGTGGHAHNGCWQGGHACDGGGGRDIAGFHHAGVG